MPKAVQPWEGMKNAQVWGPVCPAPEQTNVSADELVFPHRYWVANEHCQYLNVWTQNLTPGGEEAGHGVDARRRLHQRLLDGVVRLRRPHAQRVRRRRGGQHEPPAEHSRHARSVGLWSAVRQLALHRHGRPGGGAAVGARQHRSLRRRSRQRDDLRAVRRRRQGRPHDAHAGGEGALPQGRGAERRQQHLPHDRRRREHQGAADDRGAHAQEPESHAATRSTS